MEGSEPLIGVPPDPARAAQEGGSVRKARQEERTQVVRVLARAFYDDPVMTWFFREDSRRMEQLERVFGFFGSRVWFSHDLTYTTEHVAGAAVWVPPEQWRVSVFDQLRMMPGLLSSVGLRDLPRALRGFNLMESKHPDDRHYYLPVIVDRSGRARGSAQRCFGRFSSVATARASRLISKPPHRRTAPATSVSASKRLRR